MTASITAKARPPVAKGLPFVGNLMEFGRDPLTFLQCLARSLGDVAEFRLGRQRKFQINHPDLIRDVLVTNHRNFTKTGFLARARPVLGEGLVTSEGEFHRRQRRLTQPALDRQRVPTYGAAMAGLADRAGERWSDELEIDMSREMMSLTLNIVAQTLFSIDLQSEAHEIETALTTVIEHFNRLLVPYRVLLSKLPIPGTLRYRRAAEWLDRLVYKMIEERRQSGGDRGDVLSMLLVAQDTEGDHSGMSDRQVRDEVMTLFTAGHETIATALTWTWYALSQNPTVEAQLHRELDRVLGGRLPTADDLPELSYTRMVFAESMRLFPPVWAITRRVVEDYPIGNFVIPAGSGLGMSQFVMQRDERYFPAPDRFDPLRWTPEAVAERPKYSYFPFGGGIRLCIGESFAWQEGILVMATLCQHWKARLHPEAKVAFQPLITLRPRYGMRMILEKRDPVSAPPPIIPAPNSEVIRQ